MDLSQLHGGEALQVRGSEEEANGRQERVPERVSVYITGWVRSRVHRRWMPLGIVGGSLRRHCALSLGVG
jgi:hypothetical protein